MHRLLAPRGRLDLPWYLNVAGSPKEIRQFKCHDGGSTRSVVGQQLEVVEWNGLWINLECCVSLDFAEEI